MKRQYLWAGILFTVAPLATATASAEGIAGLNPSVRPAGAPVISEVAKPEGWYTRALNGVSKPYPASLRFLVDQGAWFSPFIHAGMTGPYDIRGWHSEKPAEPAN